jgi:hypothetical protein
MGGEEEADRGGAHGVRGAGQSLVTLMTARRLVPETLEIEAEVLTVLIAEGLVSGEVTVGKDGKGRIRFRGGAEVTKKEREKEG